MNSYTVHTRDDRPPVVLREGWSWGAALLGPVWFLLHRDWVPAGVYGGLIGLLRLAAPSGPGNPVGVGDLIGLGLVVLAGLMGRDVLRWSMELRGYVLEHVLVARDGEAALGRLLHARADLRDAFHEHVA